MGEGRFVFARTNAANALGIAIGFTAVKIPIAIPIPIPRTGVIGIALETDSRVD
jgi:hypothetical protein